MRYVLLIYQNEAEHAQLSQEDLGAELGAYMALTEEMQHTGLLLNTAAIQPIHTATTVRVRGGKTVISDGPFAETKEHLRGYVLLNCQDLDEALALAPRIPAARYGSIEIRPVMELD
ncbi:MAG TPA: YciI family protein [Ktedonobacteraceae bacterium]